MKQQYELKGSRMIYYMPKEVDHHAAEEMRNLLEQMIAEGVVRELIFDFAGTDFMDSAGIGVVLGRSKTLSYYKGSVEAIHVGKRLARIFRAAGVGKMVKIEEDEEWSK